MAALFQACCGSCFGTRPSGRSYFPERPRAEDDFDEDDRAAAGTMGGRGRRDSFATSFGGSGVSVSSWFRRVFGGASQRPAGYGGLGGAPATGEDLLFNDEDMEDEPEVFTRQNINSRLQEVVRGTGNSVAHGFPNNVQSASDTTDWRGNRDFAVSPFARLAGPPPSGFATKVARDTRDDDFG